MKLTLKPTILAFTAVTTFYIAGCNSDNDKNPEPNLSVVEDDLSVNLVMDFP